ncbi:MAG: endopeptidase La, partial [Oscillospiraceae bacterium]|nr:endopeptidase La [Oscillospiraceae bacterium]
MLHYIEKVDKLILPLIPLRGLVVFPSISISFEITNELSINVCKKADEDDKKVFLVTQKDISVEKPVSQDLNETGVIAKIKQYVKLPEGNVRVIVEGLTRATATSFDITATDMTAEVMSKQIIYENEGGIKGSALSHEIQTVFEKFITYMPKLSKELILNIQSIKSIDFLSDYIACYILISLSDKQAILNEYDPLKRLELLAVVMEREIEILNTEMHIHKKVRSQIDSNQREYYLKEQLKAIQNELGYSSEADNDIDEYYNKIYCSGLPEEVETKLLKELRKLTKMPFNSAESSVIKNYLDICLELPWTKLSKDRIDISAAQKILERDHDGLEKIKERILEFLAVKQLNPGINNQILCLLGPPGTGKTLVVESIARAMKRQYVRISLGGIRDEADIRGHRKTYIGSMPGRIINALKQAGTRNPIILLDEIDKLTRDAHGDPASALLEALDSEQNKAFRDHFIELPIDLRDCIFITTANTLDTVPRPLIDRMEIIELKIYTRHEKLAIAINHLIPKQIKRHGLSKRQINIDENALFEIIDFYTREAGVRNLEREIANICRKVAKNIVETGAKKCVITKDNLNNYLGVRKIIPEKISDEDEIGEVNGLAYTELGGDMLKIEVAAMTGTGKIELTGSLGEVMKESA